MMHGRQFVSQMQFSILYIMLTRITFPFVRLLAVALLCAWSMTASGQQVVNGSFESLVALPSTTGQWNLLPGWMGTGSSENTPDAFHMQGTGGGDLPETPVAMVSPDQGMAIAGFMATGEDGANRREYITGTFSVPLEAGAAYRFTFRMTNGERTAFSQAGLGVSKLGMHFSMGPLQQIGAAPLSETPQFELTPVFYSREWETVSFTFIAQNAWTCFTWGAFGGDEERIIAVNEGDAPTMAYCFVDAFEIALDEEGIAVDEEEVKGPATKPTAVNLDEDPSWFVPNAFTPNNDGENDVFVPVWNNVELRRFEVFSRWGEKVFALTANSANGWDGKTSNGKDAEPGTYVWQVDLLDADGKTISKSGAITLIR